MKGGREGRGRVAGWGRVAGQVGGVEVGGVLAVEVGGRGRNRFPHFA